MGFKSFKAVATGLVGVVHERQEGRQVSLLDYFQEVVEGINNFNKRHDPFPEGSVEPSPDGKSPKAIIAADILNAAAALPPLIDGLEEPLSGEFENNLRAVLDDRGEKYGLIGRDKVSIRDGDFNDCMQLKF